MSLLFVQIKFKERESGWRNISHYFRLIIIQGFLHNMSVLLLYKMNLHVVGIKFKRWENFYNLGQCSFSKSFDSRISQQYCFHKRCSVSMLWENSVRGENKSCCCFGKNSFNARVPPSPPPLPVYVDFMKGNPQIWDWPRWANNSC